MGYFSNSDEGDAYEAQWCTRCAHSAGGCAVWLAHLLNNHGQSEPVASVLNLLIPRSKDGSGNNKCNLFVTHEDVKRRRAESKQQGNLFK